MSVPSVLYPQPRRQELDKPPTIASPTAVAEWRRLVGLDQHFQAFPETGGAEVGKTGGESCLLEKRFLIE